MKNTPISNTSPRSSRRGCWISSFCLTTLLALALADCSKTPAQLRQQVIRSESAARTAQAQGDAKAARRAAKDARRAADQFKKLADKSDGDEMHGMLGETETAARSALEFAQLAEEEKERRDVLKSFKVKAYRTSRGFVLGTVLPQLAAVAEKAGKEGTNNLSALEQPIAAQAWKLASLVGMSGSLPDGSPDWSGAAKQLRFWSANNTVEFKAFLGLSMLLLGNSDFALAEFESVETNQLSTPNAVFLYHGGRAVLYALHGWNRLAAPEIEAFGQTSGLPEASVYSKQIVAVFHALLACKAQRDGDFNKFDMEVAQTIQVWPDNPLAVFLTGERLAANGEWEQAAISLEARAAGTDEEWIAKRFAQRARDLRDGKGSAKALVMDREFLTEVVIHFAAKGAKDSEAGRKLGEIVDAARSFGQELRQKLPLLGDSPVGKSKQ
jgi:hypothetical protein